MKRFFSHKFLVVAMVLTCILPGTGYASNPPKTRAFQKTDSSEQTKTQTGGELWARTELYFGSARPDGSVVTEEEFRGFLNEEITPRFPDGLTLLVALGQFRDSSGAIIQERTMLLILLYPPQKESNRRIEKIREIYKRVFNQQSVLRVDSIARVSF